MDAEIVLNGIDVWVTSKYGSVFLLYDLVIPSKHIPRDLHIYCNTDVLTDSSQSDVS